MTGGTSVPSSYSLSGGSFISNNTLTLPTAEGTLTGGTFTNKGNLILSTNTLVLSGAATLVQGIGGTINGDNTVASVHVMDTAILTHEVHNEAGLALTVSGDVVVDQNAKIDVSAKGLTGGINGTVGGIVGEAYVEQIDHSYQISRSETVGGTHGGQGSGSVTAPYDSVIAPFRLGSGAWGNPGGIGGGRVDLLVGGTLAVEGRILADGEGGKTNGRQGGGGTVRLRTQTFAGTHPTATISVNGGSGTAGQGGGGRLAIEYTSKTYQGKTQASGGVGTASGAGTMYERNTSTGQSRLLIEQLANLTTGALATTTGLTTIPSDEGPFPVIDVRGARVALAPSSVGASTSVSIRVEAPT